jgi:hypothetical protein
MGGVPSIASFKFVKDSISARLNRYGLNSPAAMQTRHVGTDKIALFQLDREIQWVVLIG